MSSLIVAISGTITNTFHVKASFPTVILKKLTLYTGKLYTFNDKGRLRNILVGYGLGKMGFNSLGLTWHYYCYTDSDG